MSNIPAYDIEENLRRIGMQRKVKFVVVEGCDDIPIYESVVSATIGDEVDFDIIYSGGKPRIKRFIQDNSNLKNCMFIVDKDFDKIDITSGNIVYLNRYSIENFYFCEDVIKSVIAMTLRIKRKDVLELINLNQFVSYSTPFLEKLFYAIFYYQKVQVDVIQSSNVTAHGWSNEFICMDNNWKVCPEKINRLIQKLYPDGYDEKKARDYYQAEYITSGSFITDFPGKMLKVALQRYLRDEIIKINSNLGSRFSNTETTCTLLTSNLHRSSSLQENLKPVYKFLLD